MARPLEQDAKFQMRLPKELLDRAKEYAKREGKDLAAIIRSLLEALVKE